MALLFGKGFSQFRAIGIRVEHPKEYQLKSRRYNQVKELGGSSELRLRMADGRALFGRDSSLVEIRRVGSITRNNVPVITTFRSPLSKPDPVHFYSLIESAKLCGVEPKAYLLQATRAALENPGTVTLPHALLTLSRLETSFGVIQAITCPGYKSDPALFERSPATVTRTS